MPRPRKDAELNITCVLPNLWTTRGKMYRGDTIDLPRDEAQALVKDLKAMLTPNFGGQEDGDEK